MLYCKAATLLGLNLCESEKTIFDQNLIQEFVGHVNTYGLSYGTREEFKFRMEIYSKNDQIIKSHN